MEPTRDLPCFAETRRIDLLCDDFEARWLAGEKLRLEDFVAALPESLRAEGLLALLAVEWELRTREGQTPSLEEYQARFPQHRSQIAEVLAAGRPSGEKDTSVSGGVTATQSFQELPATLLAAAPSEPQPTRVGRFVILSVLGEGAFGTVYKARDPQLDRDVAVKVPKVAALGPGFDAERFLREAKTAAQLRHPNICPVYEVGMDNQRLFIVMAFVEGQTLADFVKNRKSLLPPRRVAQLIRRLALALRAAHEKGIVHRDLKPSNILIDHERSDIVITDFGLARRPRQPGAVETQSGVIMGTPAYMAPEQARGDVRAIGPHTDVYSLGVILYELLCGRRPFGGTVGEVIGQVIHVEPEPPSRVQPDADHRLEAICLKAMAKDPAARHGSMHDLADALNHYLREGRTVQETPPALPSYEATATAPPPALQEVIEDLATDQPGAVEVGRESAVPTVNVRGARPRVWAWLLGIGLLAALVVGGVAYFSTTPTVVRKDDGPRTAMEETPPKLQPPPAIVVPVVVNPECPLDGLNPAAILPSERRPWHPPELVAVLGNSGMRFVALSLAFSPDNTLVAAGGEQEKSVKVWEVASGKEVLHLGDFPGWVCGVAFSPDGKLLYAGSGDEIRVVDFATKKTLHTWRGQRGGLAAMALSPDGKLLVAAGGGQHGLAIGKDMELWDTATGQKLRTARGVFSSVAFSPDGRTLAVGTWAAGGNGGAALWDAATLTERKRLADVAEAYWVAFSGNGQLVAVAGSTDTKARVYEAATGKLLRTIACQQTNVVRVALQANGQVLATASDNATVKLWETATGQEIRTLIGHKAPILTLAMTPDGQTLATGAEDGTVRLWEAATGRELFPRTGPEEVGAIAVSPDGATVATGGPTLRLWEARTGKVRQSLILHRGSVGGVAFSPDGKTLASSGGGGIVRLWDAATGDARQSFTGVAGVGQVAFSRDGRLLAAAIKGGDENAQIWDLTTGQLQHTLKGRNDPGTRSYLRGVAFSPTESLLATCSGPTFFLWDPATGQKAAELTVPNNEVTGMAFSPDGRRLASCYFGDLLKLWDVATRKEIRTLRGHGDNLSGVAWSPDGKWLASAGADGTVRLWDGETGTAGKVFRLHSPSGHLGRLTFSPEGRHLLVNSGQGTVYVLRLWPPVRVIR